MKYFKLVLVTFVSLFLVGCNDSKKDMDTIYYDLDIGTTFEENITILLDKNAYKKAKENIDMEQSVTSLEYNLLYEDIEPVHSNHVDFYTKKIDKGFNNIKVDLSYNYIEEDFTYSNYIINCFENYEIISNEKSLEIYLSGNFYCLNDKKNVNIRVNSIFDVKESNGVLEDNTYVWNITSDNVNNVDIKYVILRNYDGLVHDRSELGINEEESSSNFGVNGFRVVLLILVIGFIIGIKIKLKNEVN